MFFVSVIAYIGGVTQDSETFRFLGTLTFEEYLEAHLHCAAPRRRWVRAVVVLLGLALWYAACHAEGDLVFLLGGGGGGAFLYAFVVSPWQFRLRVRLNWDRYPRIRKPQTIELGPQGFTGRDDNDAPVLTSWENINHWAETKSAFLFYLSPQLPLVLPKRMLTGEQSIDAVRQLISSRA